MLIQVKTYLSVRHYICKTRKHRGITVDALQLAFSLNLRCSADTSSSERNRNCLGCYQCRGDWLALIGIALRTEQEHQIWRLSEA
jgi:hypothetical protein